MTNALPVPINENEVLTGWADNSRVPVSALIMMVLFALFVFISRKTAFGRSVFIAVMPLQRSCAVLDVRRYAFLFYPFGIISGGDRHFVGGPPSVPVTQVPQRSGV